MNKRQKRRRTEEIQEDEILKTCRKMQKPKVEAKRMLTLLLSKLRPLHQRTNKIHTNSHLLVIKYEDLLSRPLSVRQAGFFTPCDLPDQIPQTAGKSGGASL